MDNVTEKNASWVRPAMKGALKYLRRPAGRAGALPASIPGAPKKPIAKNIATGALGAGTAAAGGAAAYNHFSKPNPPQDHVTPEELDPSLPKDYLSPGLLDPDLSHTHSAWSSPSRILTRLRGPFSDLSSRYIDPVKALAPSYGGSEEVARQQIEQANALRAKYPGVYGLQPIDTNTGIRTAETPEDGKPSAVAAHSLTYTSYKDAEGNVRRLRKILPPLVLTWPDDRSSVFTDYPLEHNGLANVHTDVDARKFERKPSVNGHEFTHAVNFPSYTEAGYNPFGSEPFFGHGAGVNRLAKSYPKDVYARDPREAVQNAAQMKRLARHNFNQAAGSAPVSEEDWRKAYRDTLGYKIPSARRGILSRILGSKGDAGVQPMNMEHARFINYMTPGEYYPYEGKRIQQQYDNNVNKFIDAMLKRNPDGTFFQDGIVRNRPSSVVKQASWEDAAQWAQENIQR